MINGMKIMEKTKFQHSISKITPARPEKHNNMHCKTACLKRSRNWLQCDRLFDSQHSHSYNNKIDYFIWLKSKLRLF